MLLDLPCLLITDDDRDFRETLRGVFEPRGFRTLLARDGHEAVEIVRVEPVHVLLVDMHMPRWSGLETIERIKQVRGSLPWILMSAQLDEQLAAAARRAEAFSVLAKPMRFAELTAAVRQALHVAYHWPSDES